MRGSSTMREAVPPPQSFARGDHQSIERAEAGPVAAPCMMETTGEGAGQPCPERVEGGRNRSSVGREDHRPHAGVPDESLRFGQVPRLAGLHRACVAGVMYLNDLVPRQWSRLDELNALDRGRLERVGDPLRLARRLEGIAGADVVRAVVDVHSSPWGASSTISGVKMRREVTIDGGCKICLRCRGVSLPFR